MHWLIFMTLPPLLYSLVSAAPPSEGLIPKPENGQYADGLIVKDRNSTLANTTTEGSKISLEEIVTEKPVSENKNTSESNFSTQKALKSEDASETAEKAVRPAEEKKTEKREDAPETAAETTQPSEEKTSEKREDASETTVKETQPSEEKTSEKREEASETTVKQAQPAEEKSLEKRQNAEPAEVQTGSETTPQQQTPEPPSTQTSLGQQETVSETPSVTVSPPTKQTTKRPKPSKPKPKPQRATTLKPLAAETPATPVVTVRPTSVTVKPTKPASTQRYPCRCGDGTCSCCTGIVLENFNVPLRSRACANITYEPDDFAFNFRLAYNNIVLYNRRMSAKNPRPACIPINRYFGIKMCAKLSNIYMSGRNMHACLDFEGFFDDETAFKYSFNCFRIGTQGVAIVRPEDGGGLPSPPDEEEPIDEDYDDSARAWNSIGEEKWERKSHSNPTFNLTSQNQIF